uniref:Endonuclease/exonuclease/phosphatase domain-containing protein n=2 Tax=Aegilops tauschii subsp. strangulata TaxID=200361 RepID=A0A453IQP4_AEGTS
MNILAWNCRGVGNRRTVREVLALVKANDPKLVFLSETRQDVAKVEKLKWRLGLKGFHGVSSNGKSGGLALFWDESLSVTVLDACCHYIDVRVDDVGGGTSWIGTFVYGEPRVENRQAMWDHLVRLRAVSQEPWFVCGEYNKALWQHEHLSRSLQSETQMSAFRDCLLLCELMDLGFAGVPYTYNNGQDGDRNVQVKLDRACADE